MKFTADQLGRIVAVYDAQTESFVELSRIAGLDPSRDFVRADLRGVDFGSDDLTGFDFRGADLRGTDISRAKGLQHVVIDGATVFSSGERFGRFDVVRPRTPKGDEIILRRGATVLDFAYTIHTSVGHRTVAAKVNGQEVSLGTPVLDGQIVEVICSENEAPQLPWEQLAVSNKAKSQIKRFIRHQEEAKRTSTGKKVFEEIMTEVGLPNTDKAANEVAGALGMSDPAGLYLALAENDSRRHAAIELFRPASVDFSLTEGYASKLGWITKLRSASETGPETLVCSKCCTPVPGDRIVGVPTANHSIDVHSIGCEELVEYDSNTDWVDLTWRRDAQGKHMWPARLVLRIEAGNIGGIANVIEACQAQFVGIGVIANNVLAQDITIDVDVRDLKHLYAVVRSLRVLNWVQMCTRVRSRDPVFSIIAHEAKRDDLSQHAEKRRESGEYSSPILDVAMQALAADIEQYDPKTTPGLILRAFRIGSGAGWTQPRQVYERSRAFARRKMLGNVIAASMLAVAFVESREKSDRKFARGLSGEERTAFSIAKQEMRGRLNRSAWTVKTLIPAFFYALSEVISLRRTLSGAQSRGSLNVAAYEDIFATCDDLRLPILRAFAIETIKPMLGNVILHHEEEAQEKAKSVTRQISSLLAAHGIAGMIRGDTRLVFGGWNPLWWGPILEFRVETADDCYRTLGALHGNYQMVPSQFEDHLKNRPDGERFLRTTIIGPEKTRTRVDILLRSRSSA